MNKISKMKQLSLEDVMEETQSQDQIPIGKFNGMDLFIKKGKFGTYAQWGDNKRSLKEVGNRPIENICYKEVLEIMERDNTLDPSKPVGLVRELEHNLSIRSGKFGDYIYYKKPRAKKPDFLKLKGFNDDCRKCDKDLLINWIKQTYNI
jgi:DNA topoisomerase-1